MTNQGPAQTWIHCSDLSQPLHLVRRLGHIFSYEHFGSDTIHCFVSTEVEYPNDYLNFSWYTGKRWVKDWKNSSDLLKWKTHLELLKKTINEVNQTLSPEEPSKAFCQSAGKKLQLLERSVEISAAWNQNEGASEIRKWCWNRK